MPACESLRCFYLMNDCEFKFCFSHVAVEIRTDWLYNILVYNLFFANLHYDMLIHVFTLLELILMF